MRVKAIENVYVDYDKNCTAGNIYEVYDTSTDNLRYCIVDDTGSKIYLSKTHFEVIYNEKHE